MGSERMVSQTRSTCEVTLPKNEADRSSGEPVADIIWTYVPGWMDVMRSATSARPSALEESPRPCQRTTGSGESSVLL